MILIQKIKEEIKALQDVIYDLEEYEKFKLKSIESCKKKKKINLKGLCLIMFIVF